MATFIATIIYLTTLTFTPNVDDAYTTSDSPTNIATESSVTNADVLGW